MKKLICAALICAAPIVNAEFWDGNKLYSNINGAVGVGTSAALGFVIGVHDVGEGVLHCSPSTATAGQVRDVVSQYLNEFPSLRHNAAHVLVNRALQRVWPCPAKGNPT
jgi:hypothetical protein